MLIVIIAILFIVWVVHDFKKAGAEITNEHSIRQYLDYLVRNKGWTKSSGLIPIYTSPCGKKGCYADWEMQIYDCHHKKKLTTAEIAAFFEQFQQFTLGEAWRYKEEQDNSGSTVSCKKTSAFVCDRERRSFTFRKMPIN